MQEPARENAAFESLFLLVKAELAGAGLDCECRDRLTQALERLAGEHRRRRTAEALARARILRDKIYRLLALLDELDELTPDEADRSAFTESADVFDDVGHVASAGSACLRQAAANLSTASGKAMPS